MGATAIVKLEGTRCANFLLSSSVFHHVLFYSLVFRPDEMMRSAEVAECLHPPPEGMGRAGPQNGFVAIDMFKEMRQILFGSLLSAESDKLTRPTA